jgi:integrase
MDKLLEINKEYIRMPYKKWTLGEWLDYWLENVAKSQIRHNTYIVYESVVRLHIKPLLGNKMMGELGISDVQLAIDKIADAPNGGGSIHLQFRQVLSTALNHAVREEILFRNVAHYIELPKYIKKKTTPWTVDEALKFLERSKEHRLYPSFLVQIIYGMRRGEAIGLDWSSIDWKNESFIIRQQLLRFAGIGVVAEGVKTKAGRRELPIVGQFKDELVKLAEQQGIDLDNCFDPEAPYSTDNVIVKNKMGGPIEPNNYSRIFSVLTKRAEVLDITNQTMRHTLVALLVRLGVQPKEIHLILGNADQGAIEKYLFELKCKRVD